MGVLNHLNIFSLDQAIDFIWMTEQSLGTKDILDKGSRLIYSVCKYPIDHYPGRTDITSKNYGNCYYSFDAFRSLFMVFLIPFFEYSVKRILQLNFNRTQLNNL